MILKSHADLSLFSIFCGPALKKFEGSSDAGRARKLAEGARLAESKWRDVIERQLACGEAAERV